MFETTDSNIFFAGQVSVSLLVFIKLYAKMQGPSGTASQATQRISGISYPDKSGLNGIPFLFVYSEVAPTAKGI
ncbi:MAG: hypothetical protein Q8M67_02305 [Bacteroidota bacterium]|jgi:hypothetical protein|nr:hypothetical protein [Bacteroidota bacterium]